LAWIHFQRGEYQLAHDEIVRAVKSVPADAVILEHYAEILVKLGQLDRAVPVLEQAVEIAPDSDDEQALDRISKRLNEIRSELKKK